MSGTQARIILDLGHKDNCRHQVQKWFGADSNDNKKVLQLDLYQMCQRRPIITCTNYFIPKKLFSLKQ
jgi:hypothetical protein